MLDRRAAVDMLRAESTAWAIEPAAFDGLLAYMARDARVGESPRQTAAGPAGVAIIPIVGPIMRRGGFLADLFGLANYSSIRQSIAAASANAAISKIVLFVDSPGGAAHGAEEAASDIKRVGQIKPVTAYVDGLAGSAALWLASQANSIVSTPSGEIGSIGAFLLHNDISRALDKAGVTATFIHNRASPYKTEGNFFEPLGKDARQFLQDEIDAVADKFIGAVASGRRVSPAHVKSEYGRGRMLRAEIAKARGLIDAIGSLQVAIATVRSSNPSAQASMDPGAIRRRLALEALI